MPQAAILEQWHWLKMSLWGVKGVGQQTICKQKVLGKKRESSIADSAPGSIFSSCAVNENGIFVRESMKYRRKKKAKTGKKNLSNWFKAKKQIIKGLTHSQARKSRWDVAPGQKDTRHYNQL